MEKMRSRSINNIWKMHLARRMLEFCYMSYYMRNKIIC